MNNKSLIILLVLAVFLVTGCKEKHNKAIDIAYQLTATVPDSSLSVLNGVNQAKLGKAEMARYALVYTIAQDKSGLDVDNDSLLRTAYTYYNNQENDSLYAKCEYYMGKYYMLNDSTELAMDCLQKAADVSEKNGDRYTQCMALEKYSRVLRQTNPRKAVEVARYVETTYSSIPEASKSNIVYTKLNVSMCLLCADSVNEAEKKCKEAMSVAYEVKDSNVLSDVYQDMATIATQRKDFKKALECSKVSYNTSSVYDITKALNLATAYLNTNSLPSCNKLLNSIHTDNAEYKYIAFNIRHLASIKAHDYDVAYNNADSAYYYLEQMYGNQLDSKQEYYNSLVKTKYEKGVAKGEARLLSWLIVVTSLFALTIILFILHSYRQYKSTAKDKLKAEHEKLLQEERIHNEEMQHKEIQLSTMRSYLLKKINIAQRIEKIRENKKNIVVLTEEDWEEIKMFVDNVEGNFISRLKKRFPKLSDEDIKFMILIRLKMSSKAMGLIYNISEKSIRQKLFVYKSKVGLEGKNSPSLRSYIESF
ncbi:hypothetical protein SAMN05216455_107210 [Segatella bryantii]|uniref:hypothetical protein n=1 Tax=Segatella bryantii TaxID=77095 RepID=UPI00089A0555|nr:hypothetical protein [Segatella bryantii]SEA47378.1 hypothetical protein SAMN05216455_107210 [Segatella bryantii]